jgi:hypothetical protein
MGEYLKFVKDFEINDKIHGISKDKLVEIFKKVSYCH